MPVTVADAGLMSIDEFMTFYDRQPDGQKWELIEGVPVMSPSPTDWHQVIAGNVFMALGIANLTANATWVPSLGVSTRVPSSPRSLPQPDIMVFEHVLAARQPIKSEALVLIEVLSDSNTPRDQAWRRQNYASVPNCRHYVTVDSRKVSVVRYDRDAQWADGVQLDGLGDMLALPGLGIEIRLADIYRWVPTTELSDNTGSGPTNGD